MKTIEERAEHYANVLSKGCCNAEKQGRYIGYTEGATEQREIDIEKAWRWIELYRNCDFGAGDGISHLKQHFINTMKEE